MMEPVYLLKYMYFTWVNLRDVALLQKVTLSMQLTVNLLFLWIQMM